VGILVVLGIICAGAAWPSPAKPAIGTKAPNIALADLGGKQHQLSDYAGKKVVLLQFWATWCPFCQRALEPTKRLHDDYQKAGMVVVGVIRVTQRDPEDKIRSFAAANVLPYDVILLDRDGAAAASYESRGVPDTLVIDGAGILKARNGGSNFPAGPEVRRAIEAALAQLPGATFRARSLAELTKLYPPAPPAARAAPATPPTASAPPAPTGLPTAEQVYVHLQLAIAYLNIGDRLKAVGPGDSGYHKLALDELKKAEKLGSSDANLFYWLGLAHERTGDFATAARYYRNALQNAEDPRATDSLRRLGAR